MVRALISVRCGSIRALASENAFIIERGDPFINFRSVSWSKVSPPNAFIGGPVSSGFPIQAFGNDSPSYTGTHSTTLRPIRENPLHEEQLTFLAHCLTSGFKNGDRSLVLNGINDP
jgi:hypothetical protein